MAKKREDLDKGSIVSDYVSGMSQKEVAEKYGCGKGLIRKIIEEFDVKRNLSDFTCIICGSNFVAKTGNSKFCSKECFVEGRKRRRKENKEKKAKEWTCKGCGEIFIRDRKRGGFCSRSCASKFYVKNGTYDEFVNFITPKTGFFIKCFMCEELIYVAKHLSEERKFCSRKCFGRYMSVYFSGENNSSYGRKESQETKEKKKKTLMERYGVDNAFYLAKHKMSSKPQKEIATFIENLGFKIKENFHIKFDESTRYLADIFIEDFNLIIEYNGDYWHCNPIKYDENYFHKKKGKFAKEIWNDDEVRFNNIEKLGYNIIIIWESDYKNLGKDFILKKLREGTEI